ncbi:potassium-transporting ATPase subunit A [uncultured Clostridium sp.]|uniref:potassium-transporting ATPase subunit KdpA n=1 Tax=uncultured Clostridium sp. TaxID=59620 RepID=UPI0008207EB4|nr:potassium-transporting ATPase subunit KdpA [uncultured Clostridium sp.]SCJ50567.1 potassium-transporting ATPase subunit A [uncultured Clostridium sp.]
MLQIILILCLFILLVISIGRYLYHIADNKKTFADPVFNPIDNFIFKICGIKKEDMNWKQYALALIATNGVMILIGYIILRIQSLPIFNPNSIKSMEPSLSFNTIISFMTNTNLQHYSGESSLSYLSQMTVIIFMMFVAAASGYAVCMAFIRGIAGKKSLGNFFVDVVRVTTRVLIPLSIIVGILLVGQGVPQNLSANKTVETIEGKYQDIAMGPIAALESIKHIGTNGGGFLGANSSTPLENPTVVSNIIELLSMMVLPGACIIVFGLMVYYRKKEEEENTKNKNKNNVLLGGEGRTIFIAMSILFLIGLTVCYLAEKAGNPELAKVGLSQAMGSMEGKEVRFGIAQSSLFTTVTTSFTTGTVNNMHDTLTPLGGMVALLNMMLNVVFGGKGVGFMNMALYAVIAVFICGLMIGRTPEYLGKKIEGKEMKLAAICIILHPLLILAFSALAVSFSAGASGISNPGFHGLTQVLYEFASSAANNGSGFEGLVDNSYFWNITTGIVMFIGRYITIIIQLAITGSLMAKRRVNESIGTLRTNTFGFSLTLVMVVLIFSALTFFPVLSLGPIAEHLTLWR